jgi:predicted nucleotidyltransferase
MGSTIDTIASALFGKTRQAVLALLYTHDEESFYLRQIARAVTGGQGAVQRELARLTAAGLLIRTAKGNQVHYQANPHSPVFFELKSLIVKTVGVADVLKAALAGLGDRISCAFVYGSLAAGAESATSDVDVMVIGNVSFGEVATALHAAQETLGREVNPSVYPPSEFREKFRTGDHFLNSVVRAPKIMLLGDEYELTRLGSKRLAE